MSLPPGNGWVDSYLVEIEWLFCADEQILPDSTAVTEDVKKSVGIVEEPGNSNAGGVAFWDHDGDASTPQKQVIPGIDSIFEEPDANGVFPFDRLDLLKKGINPDNVNGIQVVHANPCADDPCTVEETASGKDNLEDIVILTGPGDPSFIMLNDPANPGTLQEKTAIGAEEHNDRDIVFADINDDSVVDLIIARYDAPNAAYFGDPLRSGTFEWTRKDEFGAAGDGSIGIELFSLDKSPLTAPDFVIGNENVADQLFLGSGSGLNTGAGEGVFNDRYYSYDIPNTELFTTKDIAVVEGVGLNGAGSALAAGSFIVVFANDDVDQVLELDGTKKVSLMSGSTTLSSADVLTLDSSQTYSTQAVELRDVDADGTPDVVLTIENDAGDKAVRIFKGITGSTLTNDALTEIESLGTAIEARELGVSEDGTTISLIDAKGGVYVFEKVGGVWQAPQYPDPNIELGSTTPSTEPHNHQEDNGNIRLFDADGDGSACRNSCRVLCAFAHCYHYSLALQVSRHPRRQRVVPLFASLDQGDIRRCRAHTLNPRGNCSGSGRSGC